MCWAVPYQALRYSMTADEPKTTRMPAIQAADSHR